LLEIEGSRIFKGAGGNTKTAKTAAAKYALWMVNEQKTVQPKCDLLNSVT